MEKIKNVKSPFMCYCAKVIPLAFDESMSYYECLCNFYNYLKNEVMPVINNNAEATQELQELYIELKKYIDHYFDNLDIQEEINNKLDEMYEDGKLTSLITSYLELQTTYTFDTLNDMKEATNFINGCYAKTLGYNELNDGGGATYKIRTIEENEEADEKFIISLYDENLIAELIYKNKLNVNQIGIFGDNETNVTDDLNYVLSKPIQKIYLPHGTYLINEQLVFGNNNMSLLGENVNNTIIKIEDNISSNVTFTSYIASTNKNNIELGNLQIDGGTQTVSKYFISLIQGSNIKAHNLEIYNGFGYATRFNDTINLQATNIYVHDINGFEEVSGGVYGMNMQDARIEHIKGSELGDHLLYITGDNGGLCSNIYINDIQAYKTGMDRLTNGSAITIYGNTQNVNLSNVIVNNSTQAINITEHGETLECPKNITICNVIANNCEYDAIVVRGHAGNLCDNIIMTNFTINNCGQDGFGIRYSSNITINNNIIKNVVRYAIDLRYCEDTLIQNNNTINCGVGIRSSEYSSGALISNNYGIITSGSQITGTYGLIVGDTSTNHKTYNNYFNGYTVSNYLIRGTTNKSILQGNNNATTSDVIRSVYYGNSVSSQEGQKGDICFNSNATVGSPLGWVCVESGTPGTWKAFSTIEN